MAPTPSTSKAGKGKSRGPRKGAQPPNQRQSWDCAKCTIQIGDDQDTIECFKCLKWNHKDCTELTDAEYEILTRGGESLLWQCEQCILTGTKEREAGLKTEQKLDRLVKLIQEMAERLERLEGAAMGKTMEDKIEEVVKVRVTEMMEESREKEARKLNIIIANLPESEAHTIEEKKREDRDRVRTMVSKICEVQGGDLDNPIRMGPTMVGRNVRPRLLRMTAKNEQVKEEIMRNVYSLNAGVPFDQRVYINNDSTPQERMKYRALKEELNRRMEAGERDIVIRNLKIVKRKYPGTAPERQVREHQ